MEYEDLTKIDALITSFLNGSTTQAETKELVDWIHLSEENRVHFMRLKNLWESSQDLHISTEKSLHKVLKQIEPGHTTITFWQFWQKAAAILFLPLLIATLWLSSGKNVYRDETNAANTKITAPFGSFASFGLPDGSKVWLNAGSSIEYPHHFKEKTRIVNLVGEAYFEVKSNPASPFIVKTPYFNVKATGTRFNVMAFPGEAHPTVSLVEGKVSISKTNTKGDQVPISTLQPNHHFVYDVVNGTANIVDEDSYKHIAWKDGKLVFRNDLLSEVAKKISRQYNIDIEIIGEPLNQYRFRASFENEPLDELLRLLKISSPIDFREVEPTALADGTFSRRKIIIYSAEK